MEQNCALSHPPPASFHPPPLPTHPSSFVYCFMLLFVSPSSAHKSNHRNRRKKKRINNNNNAIGNLTKPPRHTMSTLTNGFGALAKFFVFSSFSIGILNGESAWARNKKEWDLYQLHLTKALSEHNAKSKPAPVKAASTEVELAPGMQCASPAFFLASLHPPQPSTHPPPIMYLPHKHRRPAPGGAEAVR